MYGELFLWIQFVINLQIWANLHYFPDNCWRVSQEDESRGLEQLGMLLCLKRLHEWFIRFRPLQKAWRGIGKLLLRCTWKYWTLPVGEQIYPGTLGNPCKPLRGMEDCKHNEKPRHSTWSFKLLTYRKK